MNSQSLAEQHGIAGDVRQVIERVKIVARHAEQIDWQRLAPAQQTGDPTSDVLRKLHGVVSFHKVKRTFDFGCHGRLKNAESSLGFEGVLL